MLAALFAIVALIYKHTFACQAVGEALKRHRSGNRQRQTLCCRQAVAAQAMAGVVFQDDFEVAQINPEGAKFEKVNRLVCKGVVYEIEFLIDVNSELFECEEGDKLTVALATSLSVDGVSEAKAIDYARGAKASANLAAALLARPNRWADATSDIEEAVRGALQDAFEAGVCQFLTRTHGLLRGDLRDGHRAPLTYLAAFTEVIVATVEAALEVDALPEPSSPEEACEQAAPLLDIRVGTVTKCWEHPEAEKLYCEEIDIGEKEGPRTIASGLRPFYASADLIQGRQVLVFANLKARNMQGFRSNGMVLCASTPDHSKVELLAVPEGAKNGDRVRFGDLKVVDAAKPAQVQKKKLLEKVIGYLKTDGKGTATVLGKHAFTLDAGVISAPNFPDSVIG